MPLKKEKRADGRYQTTLNIGFDERGKIVKKYFYGKTQKEANAKKQAYIKSQEDGLMQDAGTLGAWIDTWVKSSSPSEKIRINNERYARKLKNALGKRQIKDIRMIDIKQFAQDMSAYSFSTVKQLKGIVNRIFEEAVLNQMIPLNPCKGISWESSKKGTHRALEPWERELIYLNHKSHRIGSCAVIMLFAGLRRGEAIALEWEDIDFDAGIIHVNKAIRFESNKAVMATTKTEAGVREVPLLPQLKSALLEYDDRTGPICRLASGDPIATQSGFERGWESYINSMENILNGLPPVVKGRRSDKDTESRKKFSIRTHDLRHTFCTMLYNAGIGLKEAQYIMGHADPEMTMEVYTHLDEEKRRSASEILKKYEDNLRLLK